MGRAASPRCRLTSAARWRRSCSALALALASACGTPGEAPEDTADVAWRAALLRIEDTRRDQPAYLDSLLASDLPTVRARAALAAGRVGGRAHLPSLHRLAVDPDTGVAASALFALALLKDSTAVALADTALHLPAPVGVEAAWLLGELGSAGRATIVAALRDSALDRTVRGAVLLAAARLRPIPADAVMPWVTSLDGGTGWRAAYVLARGRSAAGVRALLAAQASADASVREQVARGLSRAVAGDSLGDEAQHALEILAADPAPHVRINAVRSRATYGPSARARTVGALRDSDAGVRLTAAQSLDLVLDSSPAPWLDAFSADTAFVVQRAVAAGASRRGIAIPGAAPWRRSAEWQRRAAAAELDGQGRARPALARLLPWRADSDGRVRATAAGAVAGLADSASATAAARTALRGMLSDPDVMVRAAALGGLAAGATVDDLNAALDAYVVARADRDSDARFAFWQLADSALARRGDPLPEALARRLDSLPRPADPLERSRAARMPRFASWRDSSGTARPAAWYQDRVREGARTPAPVATIETERGTLELSLFAADAPLTVYNFISLARRGYFDGQQFHRVVPNFVAQGGDPRGDGNGGPGYAIRDEINRHRYGRGVLGMALAGPNTGGSQFFITHSSQPHLDGGYTVFGHLLSGEAALDRIVQGDRIVRITIR